MGKVEADMIERTLEEIDAYIKLYNGASCGRAVEGTAELLERCKDIIQKKCSWIPVEERLPEDCEEVLCTDGKYIFLTEYEADLDAGFGDIDGIIAWMPLPESYNQAKGEEK